MSLRADFNALLASTQPLAQIDQWLWENLGLGRSSKRHPWNSGAFSTVELSESGLVAPRTRTVILRGIDREVRALDFYTDVRSAKVHQLHTENRGAEVCWMFYRPSTKIQLRLEGSASLLSVEEEESAWKTTRLASRAIYASIEPPGLVRPSTQPPETSDREVTEVETEHGRENFRVVRTRVRKADVLYLRDEGHVRARLDYREDGSVSANWVVP